MRTLAFATLLGAAAVELASGQSLTSRVRSMDGTVQVVYPSRPSACGDGEGSIGDIFGRSMTVNGGGTTLGGARGWRRECVHGPARVVATVVNGEITHLRGYVGPVPANGIRTIDASASDAAAWLGDIVARGPEGPSNEAIVPLVLADAPDPWPLLLRTARDENRSRAVRHTALLWLSFGVNERLGIADATTESDDDEMKAQAVFALSQRPRSESVPELIDIARNTKNAAARRSAIFWLSQTGDGRAADLYADLLKLR